MATSTMIATGAIVPAALIANSVYYTFANISGTPDNADQITAAIIDATTLFGHETGRVWIPGGSAQFVEEFRGNGRYRHFPKQAPIQSVDAIEYWDGENWTAVGSNNTLYTNGNYIATREGLIFTRGTLNTWRVTYTIAQPYLPEDIKLAICLMVMNNTNIAHLNRVRSEADGEQSFGYFDDANKRHAKVDDIVQYHRRYYTNA